jgi:hypothetical protein
LSRPPLVGVLTPHRELLRQELHRAPPLRDIYPHLAQVRIEFEFQDNGPRTPSPQSFAYFPAAQGFFRYACPCQGCSGEFDLSGHVAELAALAGSSPRKTSVQIFCTGERLAEVGARVPCPLSARVRISATAHPPE